jgi:hypothetical protein
MGADYLSALPVTTFGSHSYLM